MRIYGYMRIFRYEDIWRKGYEDDKDILVTTIVLNLDEVGRVKNWLPDESKVAPMVESMVGWASWEREEQGPDISSGCLEVWSECLDV